MGHGTHRFIVVEVVTPIFAAMSVDCFYPVLCASLSVLHCSLSLTRYVRYVACVLVCWFVVYVAHVFALCGC